jgi:metal-responsive CopG/Arc/MetJ family transcriptional regulator
MAAANNISLPERLLAEVEAAAAERHVAPEKVFEEAVKKYLEDLSWAKLVEYGRERGKATGYEGEEGTDRAIAEYRAEKRAR